MKKTLLIALMSVMVATPAFAEEAATVVAATETAAVAAPAAPATTVVATRGQMVVAAGGIRLGPVARLAADGSPRVIFEGRVITVPLSSLTLVDGRLISSMTRAEIFAAN